MNKLVFIKQVKGGFVVESIKSNGLKGVESIHTDLPCALAAVSDLLQPPDDKPGLEDEHRKVLLSIKEKCGCVFKIEDCWRWFHRGATLRYNTTIKDMLGAGFLYEQKTKVVSGMTSYAWVTDAGHEAIK